MEILVLEDVEVVGRDRDGDVALEAAWMDEPQVPRYVEPCPRDTRVGERHRVAEGRRLRRLGAHAEPPGGADQDEERHQAQGHPATDHSPMVAWALTDARECRLCGHNR